MPGCPEHDFRHRSDIGIRDTVLEQIAHAIDEDSSWRRPQQGLKQLFRYESRVETMPVRVLRDISKSLGKRLGIAVFAAGTNLDTAPNWIPSRLGPLDARMLAQLINLEAILHYAGKCLGAG